MALRRHKKSRSLSNDGIDLFNLALSNDDDESLTQIINPSTGCISNILCKLFTTDYDSELEKSKIKFRDATCSLYSYLDNASIKNIPKFFNNAIANLVYLILVTDGKLNKKSKIRKNLMFYYSLADIAMKNNDHNTAVLLRSALDNIAIRRLNIKHTKQIQRVNNKFDLIYGSFISCNAKHLKAILENKDLNYLPSLLILLMHLNKTKEYAKSYRSLGKFPKQLEEKNKQLQDIADNYYIQYIDFREKILDLYTRNPNELELLNNIDSRNISIKLYELSSRITK